MEKEEILRQLQAIQNELNFGFKDPEVDKHISKSPHEEVFNIKFSNYLWGEDSKMNTEIIMTKMFLK